MNTFLENGSNMYECSSQTGDWAFDRSYSDFSKIRNIRLKNDCHFMFNEMWDLFTPIKADWFSI